MTNWNWRHNIGPDGVPVQQSMTADNSHYTHLRMTRTMMGVVWEVYPVDHEYNRSARLNRARRGSVPECSVLVVNDGVSGRTSFLEHVLILPDGLCGLDDYSEHLPRPASQRLSGLQFKSNMQHVDPYDLDGDWCVVGFLGGMIDQPFILKWLPHPRNNYDGATSGLGNPTAQGRGRALKQAGRYFRRINGVEQLVTSQGDVYLDTTYANSRLKMNATPTRGRFAREQRDPGGSIHVAVKPSQSLELTWRPQLDGIGVRQGVEAELPQTNPKSNNQENEDTTNTYVYLDSTDVKLKPAERLLLVTSRVEWDIEDDIVIESGTVSMDISGDVDISAANATISVDGVVNLGGESGSTLIKSDWKTTWDTAVAAALEVPGGDQAANALAIEALQTALNALKTALGTSLTTKTKAE